jgi:putative tributyrin esterase
MAIHHIRFRANSLGRNGEFYLLLPDKEIPPFMKNNPHYNRPTKTLILLHGYSGDCTDWLYNAPVLDYMLRYNLAIVMPSGGLNFYLNKKETGRQFGDFIGKDLINYLRDTFNLATKKEDTYIGGVSMGGFGSFYIGFSYPDKFSGIIALSSALIIHKLKEMKPNMDDPVMANYEYYVDTFGDLSKAETSEFNPEILFIKNKENGIKNPDIFMACGKQDFLYQDNLEMKEFLEKEEANLKYVEGDGVHNWDFWIPRSEEGIKYFLERK